MNNKGFGIVEIIIVMLILIGLTLVFRDDLVMLVSALLAVIQGR